MFTSLLLLALGASAAEPAEGPAWLTDYGQARRQGQTEQKPLAVFFGPGKDGWQKVIGAEPSAEVNRTLAASYVCVHVDTNTAAGKRLSEACELGNGVGLVVSDRSGQRMALQFGGTLSNEALATYLNRFADQKGAVARTETGGAIVISYSRSYADPNAVTAPAAPPTAPVGYPAAYPSMWAPSFGGCSSCGR
jgi:hypothetical protein